MCVCVYSVSVWNMPWRLVPCAGTSPRTRISTRFGTWWTPPTLSTWCSPSFFSTPSVWPCRSVHSGTGLIHKDKYTYPCLIKKYFWFIYLFAASWSISVLQQSHEYPQYVVHRPLHCGNDPQTHRLQTQGTPSHIHCMFLCITVYGQSQKILIIQRIIDLLLGFCVHEILKIKSLKLFFFKYQIWDD